MPTNDMPLKTVSAQAKLTAMNGSILELLSSADVVLVRVTLDNPMGTLSNNVITFAGFPKTVQALATGTIAKAQIRTAGGTRQCVPTVGTSGAEIVVSSLSTTAGQDVVFSAPITWTLN